MAEIDADVQAAIERFSKLVEDADPRIGELLEQLRSGRNPQEVLAEMIQVIQQNPELAQRIEQAADKEFTPLREESEQDVHESITALKRLPDRQELLREINFDEEDLLFHPEGQSMPQLHPVVQGYIAERLQFDDDIPELRTGDLPPDHMPAVPVENASRDPVALGAQLETAAREVREELNQAQLAKGEQLTQVGRQLEALDADARAEATEHVNALVHKAKSDFVAVSEGKVGVDGYRAGHRAALRKVEGPNPLELATMKTQLRQKYAHKALTSTQGRQSAVPVIEGLVVQALARRGVVATPDPEAGEFGEPTMKAVWTVSIAGSAGDGQHQFSFIDTAAAALASTLARDLREQGVDRIRLRTRQIGMIADRIVGWEVRAVLPH